MNPTAYTPEPGSPVARVLDLLARNPEDDYTNTDLALKFQVKAAAWPPTLAKAKMDAANLRHKALLVHVRQVAAQRPRDEFDLRLIASAARAGVQWADRALVAELHGVKALDTLKAGIDTMALPQLTALLMDCVLVDDVLQQYGFNANMKPRPLLALAEHYGVDAQAVMAAAEQAAKPASTPSPAGASAKKAKTPPPAPASVPDRGSGRR